VNLIDSSAWLEYFIDGPNASLFEPPLKNIEAPVVPIISIYEVFKVLCRESGENIALQGLTAMQRGHVVHLTTELGKKAAVLSLRHALPMADSIILAAAREFDALIWTQDADFKGLDRVNFFEKK